MSKPKTPAKKSRSAQGKGSVYQDKTTGYWIAQLADGFKENGRPKYIRVKRKTEKEAVAELNKLLNQKASGRLIVTSRLTVGAWLEEWLEDYVKPSTKQRTYESYVGIVRRWITPHIGKIVLKELKASDIDRLLAKGKRGELSAPKLDEEGKEVRVPLSPDSLRLIRATLRRACNIAMRKDKLGENPVLRTEPPKMPTREVIHLTSDQVGKLLMQCNDREIGNLVAVALFTGLRIGEAVGLTWSNVDLDGGTIRISQQLQRIGGQFVLTDLKTGSKARRSLAIPTPAVAALKDQKARALLRGEMPSSLAADLDLVFTSPTGRPLHARNVDQQLKAMCLAAGIPPVSFHKLRHTVATSMAEAGVALDVIRDQLGHSQITLTANTYRHFVPAKQKEAADKLAELYGKG